MSFGWQIAGGEWAGGPENGHRFRFAIFLFCAVFAFSSSFCQAQLLLHDPECLPLVDLDAVLLSSKKIRAEKVIFQPLSLQAGDSLTIKAGESILLAHEVSFLEGSEVVLSIVPCSTPLPEITVYNFLTPNGDGQNDVFYIEGLQAYPQTELVVMNKIGKVVYRASPYANNWDGGDESKGIYTYHLKLSTSTKPLKGELLLER